MDIDVSCAEDLPFSILKADIVASVLGLRKNNSQLRIGSTRFRSNGIHDFLAKDIFRQKNLIDLCKVRALQGRRVARHTVATGGRSC